LEIEKVATKKIQSLQGKNLQSRTMLYRISLLGVL
jgi:hypothetical protein